MKSVSLSRKTRIQIPEDDAVPWHGVDSEKSVADVYRRSSALVTSCDREGTHPAERAANPATVHDNKMRQSKRCSGEDVIRRTTTGWCPVTVSWTMLTMLLLAMSAGCTAAAYSDVDDISPRRSHATPRLTVVPKAIESSPRTLEARAAGVASSRDHAITEKDRGRMRRAVEPSAREASGQDGNDVSAVYSNGQSLNSVSTAKASSESNQDTSHLDVATITTQTVEANSPLVDDSSSTGSSNLLQENTEFMTQATVMMSSKTSVMLTPSVDIDLLISSSSMSTETTQLSTVVDTSSEPVLTTAATSQLSETITDEASTEIITRLSVMPTLTSSPTEVSTEWTTSPLPTSTASSVSSTSSYHVTSLFESSATISPTASLVVTSVSTSQIQTVTSNVESLNPVSESELLSAQSTSLESVRMSTSTSSLESSEMSTEPLVLETSMSPSSSWMSPLISSSSLASSTAASSEASSVLSLSTAEYSSVQETSTSQSELTPILSTTLEVSSFRTDTNSMYTESSEILSVAESSLMVHSSVQPSEFSVLNSALTETSPPILSESVTGSYSVSPESTGQEPLSTTWLLASSLVWNTEELSVLTATPDVLSSPTIIMSSEIGTISSEGPSTEHFTDILSTSLVITESFPSSVLETATVSEHSSMLSTTAPTSTVQMNQSTLATLYDSANVPTVVESMMSTWTVSESTLMSTNPWSTLVSAATSTGLWSTLEPSVMQTDLWSTLLSPSPLESTLASAILNETASFSSTLELLTSSINETLLSSLVPGDTLSVNSSEWLISTPATSMATLDLSVMPSSLSESLTETLSMSWETAVNFTELQTESLEPTFTMFETQSSEFVDTMNVTVMSTPIIDSVPSTVLNATESSSLESSLNISEVITLSIEPTLVFNETYPSELLSASETSLNVSEMFVTTELYPSSFLSTYAEETFSFNESYLLPTTSLNFTEVFSEMSMNLSDFYPSITASILESSLNFSEMFTMEESMNISQFLTLMPSSTFLESASIEPTFSEFYMSASIEPSPSEFNFSASIEQSYSELNFTSILPSFEETLNSFEYSSAEFTVNISEFLPSSLFSSLEESFNFTDISSLETRMFTETVSMEMTTNASELYPSSALPSVEETLNFSSIFPSFGESSFELSESASMEMTMNLSGFFPSTSLAMGESSLNLSASFPYPTESWNYSEFGSMTMAFPTESLSLGESSAFGSTISVYNLYSSGGLTNFTETVGVLSTLPFAEYSFLQTPSIPSVMPSSPIPSIPESSLVSYELPPSAEITTKTPEVLPTTSSEQVNASVPVSSWQSTMSSSNTETAIQPSSVLPDISTSIPDTTTGGVNTTLPPTTTLPEEIDVNQVVVTIRPLYMQETETEEFKFMIETGLLRALLVVINGYATEERRRKRALPSLPMPPNPDNITTPVTRTDRDGRDIDVLFYVHNGTSDTVIPAGDVENMYDKLDDVELSAYIGAMVKEGPRPYYYSEDETHNPIPVWLWVVVLITVIIVIVIIIIILVTWKKGMWGSKAESSDFDDGDCEKKDMLDEVKVQASSDTLERTRTPTGTPFIFGMRTSRAPPPYSVQDTGAKRSDSEKSKLGKKAKKHLGADPDDSSDVNLKGFKKLDDDVALPPKEDDVTRRRSVGYDNNAYQDTPDGDDFIVQGSNQPLLTSNVPKKSKPERPKLPSTLVKSHPAASKQPSVDTISLVSMESAPDYDPDLFEHVAKMSHVPESKPPPGDVPPPVRYLNTVESVDQEPTGLIGGKPLVSTLIPAISRNRSILDLPVQKTVPVKLCKVHPLSNQPDSESATNTEKVDVGSAAEQERKVNKELQREKEKQESSIQDKSDDFGNNNENKEPTDVKDDKDDGDDHVAGDDDDDAQKHRKHKQKKHKKRSHSKHRDQDHKDDDVEEEAVKEEQDKQEEEDQRKKEKDEEKAREKRERKKQKKEEKRKAKQKKQEQGESSKKSSQAAEPVVDTEVDKQYVSPSAKIMQDTRQQRWKKPTWQPPEPEVEERKIGRNMRAAPLQRTPSEGETSGAASRRSSVKEQELLEQLQRQQRLLAQQQELQQLAADLINEAYVKRNSSAHRQRIHDSQLASQLLNDAFSLARSKRDAANRVHSSMPTSPVPPSGQSEIGSVQSACTEPAAMRSPRPPAEPLKHRQSSLEWLYSRGALTRPAVRSDGQLDMPATSLGTRAAWNSSTSTLGGTSSGAKTGPDRGRLPTTAQLLALSDQGREMLLGAVQEELCRLNALS